MLSTGCCRPRSVGRTRICGVSRSVVIRSVLQVRCFCVPGMSRRASSRTKAVSLPPPSGWTRRSRFAGEILSYAYDYGDNWELTLRLENVLPAAAGTPSAVAVDGRRAAPPEDCGGRRTAEELAEVLEDPSLFDLDEVNEALQNPFIVLRDHGLDPRLAALIDRLTYSPVGEDLASRALSLLDERPVPDEKALHASLKPFIWFLDRAAEGGIQLTASGYLKPADVTAAAEVLPTMHGWIGKANREIDTFAGPATSARHSRRLGLLRKHKGSLLLTRAGHDSHAAWQTLWNHWRTASSRTPTGSTPTRRCSCSSTRQHPPAASFRSTRSRQRSPTWAGRARDGTPIADLRPVPAARA